MAQEVSRRSIFDLRDRYSWRSVQSERIGPALDQVVLEELAGQTGVDLSEQFLYKIHHPRPAASLVDMFMIGSADLSISLTAKAQITIFSEYRIEMKHPGGVMSAELISGWPTRLERHLAVGHNPRATDIMIAYMNPQKVFFDSFLPEDVAPTMVLLFPEKSIYAYHPARQTQEYLGRSVGAIVACQDTMSLSL